MFQEERLQYTPVDDSGTLGLRKLTPEEKGDLQKDVEGDEGGKKISEGFDDIEGVVDNPVGEPLRVILGGRSLEGLEGCV